MKYYIYWLLSEDMKKSYVGFLDDLTRRNKEHSRGLVKTTKFFGKFRCFCLEEVGSLQKARKREKYWKSAAGRKKLKEYFKKLDL